VKLLTSHSNIICLVCNTRLALSEQIAQRILVEPVSERVAA
jgi:Fe2+ transport system protein FeoA